MRVVIKLGGFAFPIKLDRKLIKSFASKFKEIHERGHRLVVVTGGGGVARLYIEAARRLGAPESFCDQVGILISRANASLIIASLGDAAASKVPETLEELHILFSSRRRVVVMGGLHPGQSTNAVAALAAEALKADALINVTDVEGVYTSDPKKYPKAILLKEVTTDELLKILSFRGARAGEYELLDLLAIKVIERSKIPTWVISGKDPSNVVKVIEGKSVGTKIIA
ncbi:TPA: UMP kinase [Candidatus Bathyarchaeota archaeon]|nr:UMP kinase [Candidatus Bathyarchaeota archaeon]